MPAPREKANLVVDRFGTEFAKFLAPRGWTLTRVRVGHSDRQFFAIRGAEAIAFLVKLSQSEKGFWGMPADQAGEFSRFPARSLVLLTGLTSGYVIAGGRIGTLLPRFSQSQGQFKINENVLVSEKRFTDLKDLADQLGTSRAA
jgi:hypothetical protein